MRADAPRSLPLLQALVAIDSVNPALVPSGGGEHEAAKYVAAWGRAHALEVTWVDDPPDRPSVVLRAPGRGGGRSLMLNAHLDTVGVEGMAAPFTPRREGERLYGRGALDMKASVAASLQVAADAVGEGLRGDVVVTAVADEEHASVGTEAVLRRVRADACVVTEPTGLDVQVAHRGFAVFDVVTRGRASHTSQPHRGVNAVAHMGRVLAAVADADAALRARVPHPLLGHGTLQPVTVAGGSELFVTPEACRLSVERRSLPGEDAGRLESEMEAVLAAAGEGVPNFDARATLQLHRAPFEVPDDADIVRHAVAAASEARGEAAPRTGAPYWTDAALVAAAGIPTVLLGPSGEGLHAADEWVDLRSVARLERALASLVRAFCA